MAFTRFKYDNSRTIKELQQSTDPGRWMIDVPGNGNKPDFMEDPNIRIQKWGANLMTNHVDIENSLLGITVNNNKDYLDQSNYAKYTKKSETIHYPKNDDLYTDQSRSTNPSWEYRTQETNNWMEPLPFIEPIQMIHMNTNSYLIDSRNLEKDAFDKKQI